MPIMKRSLDEILDVLGGESAVASLLGCGPSSVSNWKSRGLPKGRWVDLVMLGAEKGVRPPITLDEVRQAAAEIDNAWSEPA
jgi:DNA-binding transcriptional regulator YdaS (Cro superfamily)